MVETSGLPFGPCHKQNASLGYFSCLNIVGLPDNESAVCSISLLFISGYLETCEVPLHEGGILCNTQITDKEIVLGNRLIRKIITSHSSFHLQGKDYLPER